MKKMGMMRALDLRIWWITPTYKLIITKFKTVIIVIDFKE